MTKLQEFDSLVDFINAIRDCDAKYIEGTVVTDNKVSNFENSPHEYVREYIPKLADEIRQKIAQGCTVYGEHIDVTDDDSALVAAYYLGLCDPSVALRVPPKAPPDPPGYILKARNNARIEVMGLSLFYLSAILIPLAILGIGFLVSALFF